MAARARATSRLDLGREPVVLLARLLVDHDVGGQGGGAVAQLELLGGVGEIHVRSYSAVKAHMLNAEPSPVNGRIQSIDRAAELLEAIAAAPEPETAPALADACGLNRSTAWRILATLEHHGLVERDPDTNRYRLGFAVLGSPPPPGTSRSSASPTRCCAGSPTRPARRSNLAVARRLELVYADQVQARHVMAPNWLGHTRAAARHVDRQGVPRRAARRRARGARRGSSASPTRRSPTLARARERARRACGARLRRLARRAGAGAVGRLGGRARRGAGGRPRC